MVEDVTICFVLGPGPCTAIGVSADINNIPDDQMNATSHYLAYYSYNGRLNGTSGWCVGSRDNYADDYLQIDMGAEYSVCAVATQGKSTGSYRRATNCRFQLMVKPGVSTKRTDRTRYTNYFPKLLRS